MRQVETYSRAFAYSTVHTAKDTMPNTTPHIGIVGGGIGGLSAAISLRRAGAKVTLLEAAKELGEIGAGIHVRTQLKRKINEGLIRSENVLDIPQRIALFAKMGRG